MMGEDLSIDARQETRIVCTEMKLKRAEEKIGDLEDRVRLLDKRVFHAAAVVSAGLALLGLLAQISKAFGSFLEWCASHFKLHA